MSDFEDRKHRDDEECQDAFVYRLIFVAAVVVLNAVFLIASAASRRGGWGDLGDIFIVSPFLNIVAAAVGIRLGWHRHDRKMNVAIALIAPFIMFWVDFHFISSR